MTNVLFIADVIGSPGRAAVRHLLPELRRRHDLHLVICNCENSAAGMGVTRDTARELFEAGCDALTGGNHLWDKRDGHDFIAEDPRLVRPANLPPGTPGMGWRVFRASNGVSVGVVKSQTLLDLSYVEDVAAAVDMNLVMNGAGEFIELQGTGEESTYNDEQLAAMLAAGKTGIKQLLELQQGKK